jgi:hypothetical protein
MADEAKTAGERLASLAIPTVGNVTKNIDNNFKGLQGQPMDETGFKWKLHIDGDAIEKEIRNEWEGWKAVPGEIMEPFKWLFPSAKAGEIDLNKKLNAGGDKSTFTDLPIPSFFTQLATSGKSMPVADAPLLDWFKENFPAGGAGETIGTSGTSDVRGAGGGKLSSTYWSGGMGAAGKPRSLTRGGGESVGGKYSYPASEGKGALTSLITKEARACPQLGDSRIG